MKRPVVTLQDGYESNPLKRPIHSHPPNIAKMETCAKEANQPSNQAIHPQLEGPRAIRLIKLYPDKVAEQIHVDLQSVCIDDCAPYAALSYAWDAQKPSISVRCGDLNIEVTQNVHDALLELRSPEEVVFLWIDQVCINQADLVERSQQVALMGDIYTHSQKVVVWLGREDSDTAQAFEFIDRHAALAHHNPEVHHVFFVGSSKDLRASVDRYLHDAPQGLRDSVSALPLADSDECQSFISLLRRTWFGRLWVFQEVALGARLSEIRCGKYGCPVLDFSNTVLLFNSCGYDHLLHFTDNAYTARWVSGAFSGLRMRRSQGKQLESLENLLCWTDKLKCHDPRDKVYAILGLCDPAYLRHIAISYSLSVGEVYSDVTRAAITVDDALSILGYVQWFDERPEDVPSWTPDWRETRRVYGVNLGIRTTHRETGSYYNVSNSKSVQLVHSADPQHLALRGMRMQQVTRCLGTLLLPSVVGLGRKRSNLYATWCDLHREEAVRLEIPPSCLLTHNDGAIDLTTEDHLAFLLQRTLTADLYPHISGSVRGGKDLAQEIFPIHHQWVKDGSPTDIPFEVMEEHDLYVSQVIRSRLLYIVGDKDSEKTYLCLAPSHTEVGDWVCILFGGDVPFVLRKRARDTLARVHGQDQDAQAEYEEDIDLWEFIGECYVDGIMDGEFLQEDKSNVEETFVLT